MAYLRTIATVTTPPERVALTTVERVKAELAITVDTHDDLLAAKIREASSDIEAQCRRGFGLAGYTERFWGDVDCVEYLVLRQYPVVSITNVTVDDVAIDAGEYRLDPGTGMLYRLDATGLPSAWSWGKDIVVVYSGGYELPGAENPTLPAVLQAAAVELMTQYWTARGRDPSIRSEDVPGLGAVSYWVGAVGVSGELPPSVMSKILPFRRPQI